MSSGGTGTPAIVLLAMLGLDGHDQGVMVNERLKPATRSSRKAGRVKAWEAST